MTYIDLAFHIQSQQPIPADHGYLLFSAVAGFVPEVHHENGIGIHPIRGRQIGDRQLMLSEHSRLAIRVQDGQIAPLLKLAGKLLRVGDSQIRVGVPEVRSLIPAPVLRSRLVTIKIKGVGAEQLQPDNFTAALRKQLKTIEISEQVNIIIPPRRDNGQPSRRALHLKGKKIVGYEIILEGVSAEESLKVQEHGLGGKRHMGCGVFVAFRGGNR